MTGRKWEPDELALLRAEYGAGVLSPKELADVLGRPLRSIYMRARVEGLGKVIRPWTDGETQTIRTMNADGWPDTHIARCLKRDRHAVSARRKALGLPSHGKGERWRQAIIAGVKRQVKRLGLSRVTDLRTEAFKRFARESGWPEDLRPREVQILNVLADRGVPMSRLELAAAIGMRTDRIGANGTLALLASCNGPGGTYTASLMRRGLILKLKRGAVVQGKGKSRDLYFLGPAAITILEARACQQQTAK